MTITLYREMSLPRAQRALAAMREVIAEDAVSKYVARPGQHQAFLAALLDSFLGQAPYMLYELSNHQCVALVVEADPGGPSDEADCSRKEPQDMALKHAMQQGGLEPLLRLGLPRERAQLLATVRPDHLRALHQLEVEVEELLQAAAKEHGPLLHLHFIATVPEAQGQGLGGQLLKHLTQVADELGRHLYLEATTPSSKRLYERHGFRHLGDIQLGEEGAGGPLLYLMLRPAKGAALSTAPQNEL